MKKLMIICIFSCSTAFAETTVFGLELGKTTEKELKEMYPVKDEGLNKWNEGGMYSIPIKSINFEGLQSVLTIFSVESRLVAVLAKFEKGKFDYLKQALDSKYSLIESDLPLVGNKFIAYRDGSTEIFLDSPHMGFQLELDYYNKEFLSSAHEQIIDRKRQKQVAEQSQL